MIGKDFAIARLLWWWLYTRPGSLVIVTGVSQTLLGSVTWKEVRQSKPPLASARLSRGVKTSPQQVDLGAGWQALGFSTTSIERASGQHNPHLMVIIDEASGVEEEIFDAVESLGYERLVVIGNPIRAEGRFVDLIRQGEADKRDGIEPHRAVNSIQIPSTESPHAGMERSPWGLADRSWLESCYRQYGGEQSFWCRSHIHAIIPAMSSQVLIPEAWLDYAASIQRPNLPSNHPVHKTRRMAIDLSEGVGADDTAILIRDDYGILECDAGCFISLANAATKAAELARRWQIPSERISYDGLGIGRRFHEYLVKVGLRDCKRYIGGGKPREPTRFTNWRTEAAWHAADRLNPDRHLDDWFPTTTRQVPFHIPPRAFWFLMCRRFEGAHLLATRREANRADHEGRPGRDPRSQSRQRGCVLPELCV